MIFRAFRNPNHASVFQLGNDPERPLCEAVEYRDIVWVAQPERLGRQGCEIPVSAISLRAGCHEFSMGLFYCIYGAEVRPQLFRVGPLQHGRCHGQSFLSRDTLKHLIAVKPTAKNFDAI